MISVGHLWYVEVQHKESIIRLNPDRENKFTTELLEIRAVWLGVSWSSCKTVCKNLVDCAICPLAGGIPRDDQRCREA